MAISAFFLDFRPGLLDPTMDFVEQFGLEDPFFLFAAATEAIDAITQRTVGRAVEHLDNAGGEAAIWLGPGNSLI